MTKAKNQAGRSRRRGQHRSPKYKAAALARAEQVGFGAAARELCIKSQFYDWKP